MVGYFTFYNFIKREIVGVIEIATFFVPLPGCRPDPYEAGWGYGPIMRPEWIITPDTNYYNMKESFMHLAGLHGIIQKRS